LAVQEDLLLTCDLNDREDYLGLNFNTLQALRHLASNLIPVPAILRTSIAILKELQAMNTALTKPRDEKNFVEIDRCLAYYSSRLGEYTDSTNAVQKRIENMTKFVSGS
jgi:hypothetical protein